MMSRVILVFGLLAAFCLGAAAAGPPAPAASRGCARWISTWGKARRVALCDGSTAQVKLVALEESRDAVRDAVRCAG